MDDQGFDFRQPGQRREPKAFEPPPWEQDAFAELERRREERAEPRAEEADLAAETGPEIAVAAAPLVETSGTGTPPAPIDAGAQVESERPALDEGMMLEMMANLAAEDPSTKRTYFAVAMASGVGLIVLGAVLIIWSMAAIVSAKRTGQVGMFAGIGLGAFGMLFVTTGVWLVYKNLRQRGVL